MKAKKPSAQTPPAEPAPLPAGAAAAKATKREGVIEVARIRADEVWGVPKRSYGSDAGLDLLVSRYTTIYTGTRVRIPHNLAVAIPEGYFGLVLPRSSTFHEKGLIIHSGIIDPGYRGEVMTIAYNPGMKSVYIGEGERVSQLLILPLIKLDVVDVRELKKMTPGERGEKGFGSTGGFGAGPTTG